MNIAYLKKFRKYWEYKFNEKGEVMLRNRHTGYTLHYNSIQKALGNWVYNTFGMIRGFAWDMKKNKIRSKVETV